MQLRAAMHLLWAEEMPTICIYARAMCIKTPFELIAPGTAGIFPHLRLPQEHRAHTSHYALYSPAGSPKLGGALIRGGVPITAGGGGAWLGGCPNGGRVSIRGGGFGLRGDGWMDGWMGSFPGVTSRGHRLLALTTSCP